MNRMNYFSIVTIFWMVIFSYQLKARKESMDRAILKGYYSEYRLDHAIAAKADRTASSLNIWINQDQLYSQLPFELEVIHIEGLEKKRPGIR
ncbi:hypothetical protein JW935_24230 [candidate division KSB1 bacterium]|nr:hypothetical protein [candidate division KSB1 bacterium]